MKPKLTKKKAEYILSLMYKIGIFERIIGVSKYACYHEDRRVIRYRILLDNHEQINSMQCWNDWRRAEPHIHELDYIKFKDINKIFSRPSELRKLP